MAAPERGAPRPAQAPRAGRPRGRPRSEGCRQAILDATVTLLESRRYADVSIEAIAELAGVSRQTIYNWWESKAKLTMEAYVERANRRIPVPDTGSVEGDLGSILRVTCQVLSRRNVAQALAGLIAESQSDPQLAEEFRDRYIAARRALVAEVLERGIRRGELRPDLDVALVLDLLYGPIWYRLLLRRAPLDEAFARQLVLHLLPSLRATDHQGR